jgi:hypothetical protein
MPGSEIATVVTEATPFVTAAVGAYGGAVLTKARDKMADATIGAGVRILQRVFGHRKADEPIPEPLAVLAGDPEDPDALGAVRLAIRAALAADEAMLAEVRSILAEAPRSSVTQHIHAGRDAYTAGRDMTIHQRPE